MEIRTVICSSVQPPSPTAESQLPDPPQPAQEKRKRVRRWHHRGFTGCSTCRRRHVRCDETAPSCRNCTRLGLECDGNQGRMTFKVYGPPQTTPQSSSTAPKKRESKSQSDTLNNSIPDQNQVKKQESEENEFVDGLVVSPTTVPEPGSVKYRFEDPVSSVGFLTADGKKVKQEQDDDDSKWSPFTPTTARNSPVSTNRSRQSKSVISSLDCLEGRYYTHFVDEVATLLLIYDHSMNVNPFRSCFPELARSSPSMADTMEALGALHLANTSSGQERNTHFQHAMGKYGEVVKSFRTRYKQPDQHPKLPDFATCLLLSLFEMMDSQHHNWAIHLQGAREIYRVLFTPSSDPTAEAQRVAEMNHPLRKFLVSLLSYLDVAGSCATSNGTVVEGSYWRTLGGGWEYNLGIPSLAAETQPDNPLLVELRQCWSIMMEIQAAISAFGKAKQQGWMTNAQQDLVYRGLLQRLVQWRVDAPECIQNLTDLDDENLKKYAFPEVLEYAGCIEAYEKATNMFLHKVVAVDRPDHEPQRALFATLSTRILDLVRNLAKDVGRLATLWPLFIAGRETWDEEEQKAVRQTMIDLQGYGFKNVEKALDELEKAWFKQRAFPEGWVDTMDDIRSSILLP